MHHPMKNIPANFCIQTLKNQGEKLAGRMLRAFLEPARTHSVLLGIVNLSWCFA